MVREPSESAAPFGGDDSTQVPKDLGPPSAGSADVNPSTVFTSNEATDPPSNAAAAEVDETPANGESTIASVEPRETVSSVFGPIESAFASGIAAMRAEKEAVHRRVVEKRKELERLRERAAALEAELVVDEATEAEIDDNIASAETAAQQYVQQSLQMTSSWFRRAKK